jgi:hypothetical protein
MGSWKYASCDQQQIFQINSHCRNQHTLIIAILNNLRQETIRTLLYFAILQETISMQWKQFGHILCEDHKINQQDQNMSESENHQLQIFKKKRSESNNRQFPSFPNLLKNQRFS